MLTQRAALGKDKTSAEYPKDGAMQHRHFAIIAAILAELDSTVPLDSWTLARHFADELARTNSRFDRKRFLCACGVSGS